MCCYLLCLQLIELWETFLMQLDADEDGEPFFKPPATTPTPIQQEGHRKMVNEEQAEQQRRPDQDPEPDQIRQAAAATAQTEAE